MVDYISRVNGVLFFVDDIEFVTPADDMGPPHVMVSATSRHNKDAVKIVEKSFNERADVHFSICFCGEEISFDAAVVLYGDFIALRSEGEIIREQINEPTND